MLAAMVNNRASHVALEYAAQAGAEAKASTELARTSIELARRGLRLTRWAVCAAIISIVVAIRVPIYADRRANAVAVTRIEEDRVLRQQEIRVLNEISTQLAAESKARSQTATKARQAPSVTNGRPKAR